jgi:hypothetical protein
VRASPRPEAGHPARPGWFRHIAALAAVVAVLAVILASCSGGDSSDSESKGAEKSKSSTTVTTAPAQEAAAGFVGAEAAIDTYLKSQGVDYVGDCANAKLPEDKGKWCSTLVSGDANSDTVTYDLGPVGEKPQKSITLKRKGQAALTPGYQVGVAQGDVGQPSQLTRSQLENDAFITGNLILDQQAGIGNGLGDLPAGAPDNPGGGTTTTTTAPPATVPPVTTPGGEVAEYPPTGGIVVENPNPNVGGEVVFRGSGCVANEPLQVLFDGHPIGTITADGSGAFAGSMAIPPGTAPGAHTLTVRGSSCVFNTTINVGGNLAFTGSSSHTGTYVLAGIAAVVIGAMLVMGSRRRTKMRRGRHGPPTIA